MVAETEVPQAVVMNPATRMPTTAYQTDEGLWRWRCWRQTEGGAKFIDDRPLALTLAEARDKRWDFFSPTLGIIWEGYKLATDRTPEARVKDTSVGGLVPPGGYAPPTVLHGAVNEGTPASDSGASS